MGGVPRALAPVPDTRIRCACPKAPAGQPKKGLEAARVAPHLWGMVWWGLIRLRRMALAAGVGILFGTGVGAASLPPLDALIMGDAVISDGDSLRIGNMRIRLHGIDAPETAQTCARPDGANWACGRWATQRLRDLVGVGPVACHVRDHDRYGRVVARCMVAGLDLGAAMVDLGAARAYSDAYVAQETAAQAALRGIWQGIHERPAHWRATRRGVAGLPQPQGCAIKGNISDAGHIFHMPGQRDYDRVVLSAQRGERWFCSAAEARAAGWRAARN